MPLLSYPTSDFTPFTKILSSDVNGKFNAIKTLLNVTGLDDTNLAAAGITRSTKLKTGTANYVLINDGSGLMSEEQYLSTSRGGLGINAAPTAGQAGFAVVVNGTSSGFQLSSVSSPVSNILAYNRVG